MKQLTRELPDSLPCKFYIWKSDLIDSATGGKCVPKVKYQNIMKESFGWLDRCVVIIPCWKLINGRGTLKTSKSQILWPLVTWKKPFVEETVLKVKPTIWGSFWREVLDRSVILFLQILCEPLRFNIASPRLSAIMRVECFFLQYKTGTYSRF